MLLTTGCGLGGGICGVIFKKAGLLSLTKACAKFHKPLKDGTAVITPAFKMTNTKYIIHAVGPDFGKTPNAFEELFYAWYNSLCILKENNLHSVSFPLISSGIFGGSLEEPVAISVKQGCKAYQAFITNFPDYNVEVRICAFSEKEMQSAQIVFNRMFSA